MVLIHNKMSTIKIKLWLYTTKFVTFNNLQNFVTKQQTGLKKA